MVCVTFSARVSLLVIFAMQQRRFCTPPKKATSPSYVARVTRCCFFRGWPVTYYRGDRCREARSVLCTSWEIHVITQGLVRCPTSREHVRRHVKQRKTGAAKDAECFTLKPTHLSVNAFRRKLSICQGVKVPSSDIFDRE